jgi:hypothetical protein
MTHLKIPSHVSLSINKNTKDNLMAPPIPTQEIPKTINLKNIMTVYDHLSSYKNYLKNLKDSVESKVNHTDSFKHLESLRPQFEKTLYDT